jgi:nitrite reductase (NAD(P)H)
MTDNWQPQLPATELEEGPDRVRGSENETHGGSRKKIVVIGLGMVGISFM